MLINLRNALMAGKRLPYDAEVEYLESTGEQWIDTGMYGSDNVTALCSWSYRDAQSGAIPFGSRTSATSKAFAVTGLTTYATKDLYVNYSNQPGYLKYLGTDVYQHQWSCRMGQGGSWLKKNGVEVDSSSASVSAFTTDDPIILFGIVQAHDYYPRDGIRIHAFSFYVNGVLVRDYIPVRKGTVGYLYDRVSGKLFGNAGTGDFVLGPDVVPVEYIESHGTEWIDTGVKPFDGMGLRMRYKPMEQDVEQRLFGVRRNAVFNYGYYGATPNFWDVGSSRISMAQVPFDSVSVMTLSNGTIDFNNRQYSYTAVPASTYSCYLFAWNRNPLLFATARVYELKIWDGSENVLLRFFRPVRVGTEGAMMDVLTRRIYRNAGTGAFGYGNDLKYPIPAE